LANTAPVAWGAIGTPIVTLAAVSRLDQLALGDGGAPTPVRIDLVPFWLVTTFVRWGGTWKKSSVWPAALIERLVRVMQWFASGTVQHL
jgi:lactate permease